MYVCENFLDLQNFFRAYQINLGSSCQNLYYLVYPFHFTEITVLFYILRLYQIIFNGQKSSASVENYKNNKLSFGLVEEMPGKPMKTQNSGVRK